jgi:hypothetical protein
VRYAVHVARPDISEDRIASRLAVMAAAFDDALVTGWEQVCAGLDLPDPDDRHVLAAAIAGGAQSLVTFNIKDFPDANLRRTGIEVAHPDEFLLDQLDLYPGVAMRPQRASCRPIEPAQRPCGCPQPPRAVRRTPFRGPGSPACGRLAVGSLAGHCVPQSCRPPKTLNL